MSVKLREKELSSGKISFYLDIYHNKTRWYEFLDIRIHKNRPSHEDKEKKRLAQEIRAKREHELIVEDNNIQKGNKKVQDINPNLSGVNLLPKEAPRLMANLFENKSPATKSTTVPNLKKSFAVKQSNSQSAGAVLLY